MSAKINGKTLEEIEAAAGEATEGSWKSFRMTDADTGEPITHARLLEYLSGSLGKGGRDVFFVYVEKEDGGADVCISGNGPGSPFNAAHIATMDPPTTLALVSRVRELEAEWRTKYLRLAKRHIKLRFESKRLRAEVRELEARLEAVRDRLDELITDMHSESNRRVSSDIWGTELEDCKALLDTPAKEDQ